ncbi:hypothetical protein TSUD_276060 [Trifolium subterraneum]|uniref:TIR domain-containing protein n=1 Tax=Trifolium subterraneum TaxID=3900 RepID=A0A2Z6NHH8_TRISU|nr:hypothetical protein TSUD_276060 [Trifolium subterraneum]
MKCHRTTGQVVLPVFYDVDPSEVRHQTGEFGIAFQSLLTRVSNKEGLYDRFGNLVRNLLNNLSIYKYKSQSQVPRWRAALREAAGLAGFVVLNSRNESEAIKNIVEKVTHLLDKTDLFIANNPVGVELRVRDMIQLLDIQQSSDVLLIGMWGMGGIGKTTIAKAIYNKLGRNFESRSFIANIRERLENLKILKLSHSHYLTQTPNFSNLPNLEQLVLSDCPMLSEIEKLDEDLEQMESLTTLIANNTAITRVPFSIVRSKSIAYISLCGYEGFSRYVFPSIILSWMSPTNNLPSKFQTAPITSSLVPLDLPYSSSHEISSISKYLPSLRSLWVECSSELQLSHDAAVILDALYSTNNKEFESAASTSKVSGNSLKSIFIQLRINCQVANILKERIVQNMTVDGYGGVLLPSDSYPYWLTFNCKGSSVLFEVPQLEGRNLKTIMCIVYTSTPENIVSDGLKNVMVKNYTKATIQLYKYEALVSFEEEEGYRLVSSIEHGNKMEVVVVFEKNFIVKKTTIYLIYDEPIGKTMEQSDTPLDKNVIVCSDGEDECALVD